MSKMPQSAAPTQGYAQWTVTSSLASKGRPWCLGPVLMDMY